MRDAARFDAPDDRIAHASVRTGERRSTYLDGVALAHSTDPEIPGSREELSGQDDRLPAHQRAARHHGALDAAAVSRTGQGALA